MLDSLRYKIIERQLIKFLDAVESHPEQYTFLAYSNQLLKYIDRIDNLSEEFDISDSLEQRIKKTNDFITTHYCIKIDEIPSAHIQMLVSRMEHCQNKTLDMHFPSTPFSLLDESKSTHKNTAYGLLLLIYVNNLPYNDGVADLPNYWKRSYQLNTEDMIQTMLTENFIYIEDGRLKHTTAGKELATEWMWLKKIHISPVMAYELINDYVNLSKDKLKEFLPDSEWTIYDALIDIYTAKNIVARKRGEPYDLDEFRGRAIEKVQRDFGMQPSYWPSESKVYSIVRKLYPHEKIQRRCRPKWLQGLEIDIYIPGMKIGIEYQGEQHYKPVKHWGGEEALRQTQMRDKRKKKLCQDNGVSLVYINYYDDITEELVINRINEAMGVIL